MEAKKGNVIEFPGRRSDGSNPQGVEPNSAPNKQGQKVAKPWLKGAVMMAGIAVMGMILNGLASTEGSLDQASVSGQGRGIASVDGRALRPGDRDGSWERSLAQDLSRRESRGLASLRLGKRPSAEDRLRFGALKSQYAVVLDSGRLSEVRWPANQAANGMVYLLDPAEFLSEYRELLPSDFHVAVPESEAKGEEGLLAVYALLDEGGRKIAEAQFGLDRYGRLLGLSIHDPTSVQ